MGVIAVGGTIGFSHSSCFNCVKTFVAERLLTCDGPPKTYDVGFGAGECATTRRFTAEAVFRSRIDLLADRYTVPATGCQIVHPAIILVIVKPSGMHVARIELTSEWISALNSGLIGRCIAAITTELDCQRRIRLESAPWQGSITYRQWLGQVQDARLQGWAVDHSQVQSRVLARKCAALLFGLDHAGPLPSG